MNVANKVVGRLAQTNALSASWGKVNSLYGRFLKGTVDKCTPKLRQFGNYAKVELTFPSLRELPQIKSDVMKLWVFLDKKNLMSLTVRESVLYFCIALEISLWFFVGEIIGRRHLFGYYIKPAFKVPHVERYHDWDESVVKTEAPK